MNKVYFMLVCSEFCHDADEWMGVYADIKKMKDDYEKAKAAIKVESGYRSLHIEIHEFPLNKFYPPATWEDCPNSYRGEEIDMFFKEELNG